LKTDFAEFKESTNNVIANEDYKYCNIANEFIEDFKQDTDKKGKYLYKNK